LVLAGPTMPIPEEDIEAVAAWLENGGRMLVMVDPGHAALVNDLLMPWGLQASNRQIVDPRQNLNGSPPFIQVSDFTDHPVVRAFRNRFPTAFALASPVSHFETGEGSLFHQELARSSQFSLVLTPEGRESGPFHVAAASWRRTAGEDSDVETRVVLVGDSDFASSAYLPARANRNFFLNCVGWLSREEELLSIRKLVLGGQAIQLNDQERTIIYLILSLAPCLLLITGVVVAWRRRGR
jgi:ABC-type uncharacterized transport system involved in gliding motility auxiliary subunit